MKHIFLVHSPITYLVSISIIIKLEIPKEDAIIIFERFNAGVQENENYIARTLHEHFNKNFSVKKIAHYFKHFSLIGRIDFLINNTIYDKKFVAYIATLTYSAKTLITHQNCFTFNFIEEGLADYYKEEMLNNLNPVYSKDSWRSSILKQTKRVLNEVYWVLRGYNFKLLGLPFSYSCYHAFDNVSFYGLAEESFPLIYNKNKVIVSFEKENFEYINSNIEIDLDNKFVWVGDAGIVQHGYKENVYLEGIEKGCIGFLNARSIKNIFIKFHKDEPPVLRATIQKLFQQNEISFTIIPDSVIMELLLFRSTNVTLIGIYSSLLYYASIMKHNCFSVYEFVKQEYGRSISNRDFAFYWNKVTLLQPAT